MYYWTSMQGKSEQEAEWRPFEPSKEAVERATRLTRDTDPPDLGEIVAYCGWRHLQATHYRFPVGGFFFGLDDR